MKRNDSVLTLGRYCAVRS